MASRRVVRAPIERPETKPVPSRLATPMINAGAMPSAPQRTSVTRAIRPSADAMTAGTATRQNPAPPSRRRGSEEGLASVKLVDRVVRREGGEIDQIRHRCTHIDDLYRVREAKQQRADNRPAPE